MNNLQSIVLVMSTNYMLLYFYWLLMLLSREKCLNYGLWYNYATDKHKERLTKPFLQNNFDQSQTLSSTKSFNKQFLDSFVPFSVAGLNSQLFPHFVVFIFTGTEHLLILMCHCHDYQINSSID